MQIEITADALVEALLRVSESEPICILDSCGVGHLGSHLLIAGVSPVEVIELSNDDPEQILKLIDDRFGNELAAVFTLSYDLGLKLQKIAPRSRASDQPEPDVFLALFDALIIHDYDSGTTYLTGSNNSRFAEIAELITTKHPDRDIQRNSAVAEVTSNFTKARYMETVEHIREFIRSGDTYQTNLTQRLACDLPRTITPQQIFRRLRLDHPAPFAAFLKRSDSFVISASPERFFRVTNDGVIEASPIKGTRRRGITIDEDARLRAELRASEKDRAENTMIVDLVRNDLGRVCEFGSVTVEKLCDVEEHPTLFHLVSTVRGHLRRETKMSEILRAVFPCGSITGAPKIRTMEIIEELEPDRRGLSMGAIGVYFPLGWRFESPGIETRVDTSVAIRTMTIRDNRAVFNVGGGIVIDSDPEKEFDESLLKAKALINSLGGATTEEL